jgi:hypothetical protein
MGIIISGFKGCGRTYFTEVNNDKVKIFEKRGSLKNDDIDEIMNIVNDHDIIFIDSDSKTRELLENRNIDYDVFYPSKERRGEFIENQVKKHSPMNEIRELDSNFDKWIEEIDDDDSENCHKHKMNEKGLFIGNTQVIMEFMAFLKNNKKENNVNDDTSR